MAGPCPECGSTLGPQHLCTGLSKKLLGTVLDGRYEIDSVLGQGGMGMVFHGFQTSVKRPVAIKTLHATLAAAPQFFERFRREAEVASRLRHPNIITIYDFGRTPDGTCYYVMELLEGESVKELVKREGPLPLRRAMAIVEQAARGIGYAHRENVIHRDIKPHNIMLQAMDGADFVKVLDFGLVKALEQDEDEQLTSTGQVLGTPQYMPPEQAGGEPVDQRSDLYSLAGVFYFCLTGSSPFGANTVRKALCAALTETVPPVATRRIGAPLPAAFDAFFQRGLAREKPDRFQDAEELLRELKGAASGMTDAELDAKPEGGEEAPKEPGSGDHSGPNSRTLEGQARGERTPTGAGLGAASRTPGSSPPKVIVDEALAGGSRSRPKRGSPATKLVWGLAAALVLGVVGYRVRRALSSPAGATPPTPVLVENPKTAPVADPKPPPGGAEVAVSLRSIPAGADVFEGSMQIGRTPVDLRLSKDKAHSLSFRLSGYEPAERTLDLSRLTQDATELDVRLEASAKAATPASGKKTKKQAEIPVFE